MHYGFPCLRGLTGMFQTFAGIFHPRAVVSGIRRDLIEIYPDVSVEAFPDQISIPVDKIIHAHIKNLLMVHHVCLIPIVFRTIDSCLDIRKYPYHMDIVLVIACFQQRFAQTFKCTPIVQLCAEYKIRLLPRYKLSEKIIRLEKFQRRIKNRVMLTGVQ